MILDVVTLYSLFQPLVTLHVSVSCERFTQKVMLSSQFVSFSPKEEVLQHVTSKERKVSKNNQNFVRQKCSPSSPHTHIALHEL